MFPGAGTHQMSAIQLVTHEILQLIKIMKCYVSLPDGD